MPGVVLLIIILVVAFLVLKSVHDARTRGAEGSAEEGGGEAAPAMRAGRGERRAGRRPSRERSAPPVDHEALTAHVTKLREAVAAGLISADEAAASVVRQSEGQLSDEAARKLLDLDDEAA